MESIKNQARAIDANIEINSKEDITGRTVDTSDAIVFATTNPATEETEPGAVYGIAENADL